MVAMFAVVGRRPVLAIPVLVVSIVAFALGIAAVVLYGNPFSWMAAIVGTVILIDAICLKISLSQK
jgi:hypothetical protein